jgi:hypothetical protein
MTIPMPGTVKIRLYSPLLHREHREHWITISGLTVETPGGVLIEYSADVQIIDFGPEHWRCLWTAGIAQGSGLATTLSHRQSASGQPSHRGAGRDVHLLILSRIGGDELPCRISQSSATTLTELRYKVGSRAGRPDAFPRSARSAIARRFYVRYRSRAPPEQ